MEILGFFSGKLFRRGEIPLLASVGAQEIFKLSLSSLLLIFSNSVFISSKEQCTVANNLLPLSVRIIRHVSLWNNENPRRSLSLPMF